MYQACSLFHQCRNNQHGDCIHNRLVEPQHHHRQRQRYFDLPQQLPPGCPHHITGLNHGFRQVAQTVLGIADCWHKSIGDNCQQTRKFANFKHHHERDQNDEKRHCLHRVIDRAHKGRHFVIMGGPDANGGTKHKGNDRGNPAKIDRQHCLGPIASDHHKAQPERRAETQSATADLPADESIY